MFFLHSSQQTFFVGATVQHWGQHTLSWGKVENQTWKCVKMSKLLCESEELENFEKKLWSDFFTFARRSSERCRNVNKLSWRSTATQQQYSSMGWSLSERRLQRNLCLWRAASSGRYCVAWALAAPLEHRGRSSTTVLLPDGLRSPCDILTRTWTQIFCRTGKVVGCLTA